MKTFLIISLVVGIIGIGVVAGLIVFSTPKGPAATDGPINFSSAIAAQYEDLPAPETFTARDGTALPFRIYASGRQGPERLVVLVHGSAWHGMQFHAMAQAIAAAGLGTVLVPDLRGHGAAPQKRGDVGYIGQLEDDLADLIDFARGQDAFSEIILGGHSSGGGLVVRFAGGRNGAMVDRFILMAPFLKYNAPTTKPNSGGWASVATGRIIGLSIVNQTGLVAFNHLPVISFAMPRQVLEGPYGQTATTSYSFRLNQSFAPRSDFGADLAAMTQPFLLIAGAEDEAFYAELYESTISAHTGSGRYVVVPGINHIGVTTEPAPIEEIARWIDRDEFRP